MIKKFLVAAAAVLVTGSAQATTTTIDFSTYAYGASVSTVGNATFSLYGSPVSSGAPVVGSFGSSSLGNSLTTSYPTSSGISVNFAHAVKDLSFTFDNFGTNFVSFEKAFNGTTQVDFQNLGTVSGFPTITVAGNHITSFQVDNGENGSRSWQFGIGSISFSNAVPEPATWAMMVAGFGLVGFAVRRRAVAVAA